MLVCTNEVVEAEDPGHEELDESMPVPDVADRGMTVPETPSAEDREAHELAHLRTPPWSSVCVRAYGVVEGRLRRPTGKCAAPGVDHMPVIQFDYAYLLSGNPKGQQVRMRTIPDTSTGYGTACVIDMKGGGDKHVISSAVSFLKELGCTLKCLSDDRADEQVLPVETIPKSHASLGALEGWHSQSSTGTDPSFATRRRGTIWVNRRCCSSVRAVALGC